MQKKFKCGNQKVRNAAASSFQFIFLCGFAFILAHRATEHLEAGIQNPMYPPAAFCGVTAPSQHPKETAALRQAASLPHQQPHRSRQLLWQLCFFAGYICSVRAFLAALAHEGWRCSGAARANLYLELQTIFSLGLSPSLTHCGFVPAAQRSCCHKRDWQSFQHQRLVQGEDKRRVWM